MNYKEKYIKYKKKYLEYKNNITDKNMNGGTLKPIMIIITGFNCKCVDFDIKYKKVYYKVI